MLKPGQMQATLVSFYAEKPAELKSFILACQNKILETVGAVFMPYQLEQVHATIIGLEGYRVADQIKNANYEHHLSQIRWVDPAAFVEFVHINQLDPIDIKIGGYPENFQQFTSREQKPYLRSFSIQDNIVTVMGWPTAAVDGNKLLDEYRRSFNKVNVLHKWHRTASEIDDDFYLVLGRVQSLKDKEKVQLVKIMRQFLSTQVKLTVKLGRDCQSVIGYIDSQLPLSTSTAYSLTDQGLTFDKFLELYPDNYIA